MKVTLTDGSVLELSTPEEIEQYYIHVGMKPVVVKPPTMAEELRANIDKSIELPPVDVSANGHNGYKVTDVKVERVKTTPRVVFFTPGESHMLVKLAEACPQGLTSKELSRRLDVPFATGASLLSRMRLRLIAHDILLIRKVLPGSFYVIDEDVWRSIRIDSSSSRPNVDQPRWDKENGYR